MNTNKEIIEDDISLQLGYKLLPLVDRPNGEDLLDRIVELRKAIDEERGIKIPKVHIVDNMNLPPDAFAISLKGQKFTEESIKDIQNFPDSIEQIAQALIKAVEQLFKQS